MGVVDQPVKNAIGQCRITDLLVPARDRELRGEDGRAHLVAVFADLPEVAALRFRQWGHSPVVNDQDIDAAEPRQQTAQAAVCSRRRKITEQRLGTGVERRLPGQTDLGCDSSPRRM